MTAVEQSEAEVIDLRDGRSQKPEHESDRQRRRRERYGTSTVIEAMIAMLFGLVLTAILNIHQLVDAVETRDDLPAQDRILSVLEPVERIAETALFDQPRKFLDRLAD